MYDVKRLEHDLLKFENVFSIGKSVLGKHIWCVHKGNAAGPQILIHGGIHAREFITCPLVLKMLEYYSADTHNTGVYCIPMVNPDGIEICKTQPLWKANANGVDLNVNFNAAWGTGAHNVRVAGAENYIGPYPASEPETKALISITTSSKPVITLSYHSKGEVVYWGFGGRYPYPQKSRKIAVAMGYPLQASAGSAGGYKDWYVQEFGGIGLTVEVGSDALEHPLGLLHLPDLVERHKNVLNICSKMIT